MELNFLLDLTKKICEIGKGNKYLLKLNEIEIFRHYFNNDKLKLEELYYDDGSKFTRREILTRFLLLSVVLDQGPDIKGIREFLKNLINELYKMEIRILHKPIEFFKELNISIDEIIKQHESIKKIRAKYWAEENKTTSNKYSLFFAQSLRGIVPNKVLDFSIHRIGVPLSLYYLLENDNKDSKEPLINYLESNKSVEKMVYFLKNHNRYGLGNAIGDKACHLFAKLYVSIFSLSKRKNDDGWSNISYEIPFDSNAGRVLFRTGFIFELVEENDLIEWNVIQKGRGKNNTNYIRVTNIRDKKVDIKDEKLINDYIIICKKFFIENTKITSAIKFQRLPNLFIYKLKIEKGLDYSVADFDDGLIHIGLNYCFNNKEPKCESCKLKEICKGYKENRSLIENYTT